MNSTNFKLIPPVLFIFLTIFFGIQTGFANNETNAFNLSGFPVFDSKIINGEPANRNLFNLTYKFIIDPYHSKLGDEETKNKITVKFWNGKKKLSSSSKVPSFKGKNPAWKYTTFAGIPNVTHITVHTGGNDELFIDKAFLKVEGLTETWGQDDGTGWCLSKGSKDGEIGWKSYHPGCKASVKFTLTPKFRNEINEKVFGSTVTNTMKNYKKNQKKKKKEGIGKDLSGQVSLIGSTSTIKPKYLISYMNSEIGRLNNRMQGRCHSYRSGSSERGQCFEMAQSLRIPFVKLVQSSDLKLNECALIYPRSSSGVNAEIGVFTCNLKLGDNAILTTSLVHGGCDFSEKGSACEVGVFSNNLTIHNGNGMTTEFELNGPSAEVCSSVQEDQTCFNAGATLAESSVTITDRNGNGVGVGVSIGVGAGLKGGYEDGVLSTEVDLKLGVGVTVGVSVDAKGASYFTYNAGKAGYAFSKNGIEAAGSETKSFFSNDVPNGLSKGSKLFIKQANGVGKIVVGGSKEFVGWSSSAIGGFGNAMEDAFNSMF